VSTGDCGPAEPTEPHKKRLVAWAAIIGVWVGFASLGWIIGERESGPGPRRATTLGGVSFAEPKGYVLSSEPPEAVLEALGIGEPRTYGPTENVKEGAVVVGQGHGEGPELLSGRARANLQTRTGPLLERLGQDYIGVRSSGGLRVVEDGRQITRDLTVLALPAAGAVAYTVCLPPSGSADSSLLEACERLATTIGLPAGFGTSLTVGELIDHTAALEAILRRYGRERAQLRADLAHARSADGQQALAGELSALCARSGRSLSGLPYNPLVAQLQTRLLTALARCARGYNELVRAVASGDVPAYAQARSGIYAADTAMRQALKQALAP
jgi:hypothetical protein